MHRRDFVRALGSVAAGMALVPVGRRAFAAAAPVSSAAGAASRPGRLVVVFLRGAVDGLNVVIPHGDREYYQAREKIAVAQPGGDNAAIDLDGYFGLHPSLQSLLPLWQDRRLAFVHAAGSPDASRSHFDAQDFMESGTPGRKGTPDGWMNRLLAADPGVRDTTRALNIGEVVPRILSGSEVVASLPSGRAASRATAIDRPRVRAAFDRVYAGDDPVARAYQDGLAARAQLMAQMAGEEETADNGAPLPDGLAGDASRLGALMRRNPAIQFAFIGVGGWDTHANEGAGAGQLANRLKPLGQGLSALARELGPALDDTVILVMSEFGRTFRENGNGGTDHGHGNAMWILGGPVHGGRVYADWPGLTRAALYEGRDLAVTIDFRDVIATIAERHLGLDDRQLQAVLPGQFARSPKLHGLI